MQLYGVLTKKIWIVKFLGLVVASKKPYDVKFKILF